MYPPLFLNGLKTKPGLPGTGFAVGKAEEAVVELPFVADGFVLDAAGFDVAVEERGVDFFRDAARGAGEATGNGRPGCATSDVFAVGLGSGEPHRYLTGAETT